jgi:glucan biosynthesis protein C
MDATTKTMDVSIAKGERMHALDAVRGGALLLGVLFHATMSFLPGQQVWMTRDKESTLLGGLFFVSHIFRMALFFMMAGFFGRMMLHRRGLRSFVRDRLKRIGLPLVSFWPILFPAITAIFIWGIVRQWGVEALKAIPKPQGTIFQTLPLTHLWFLYVLLGLYAATLTLRGIATVAGRWLPLDRLGDALVSGLVRSGLAPLALALPAGVALYFHTGWLMWLGVPTPDTGLIPNVPAMAAYGTAFGFGWLLQRQIGLLQLLERRWLPHLVAAIGLTAVCLGVIGVNVTLDPAAQPAAQDALLRLVAASCYSVATWVWSFGLIGLAMRFLSGPHPAIRYAADSSYWIYLIHLPLIMAAQVLVLPLDLPALAKYALVLGLAVPLMPVSYHLMVRGSFLGAMLNGKRYPRRQRADSVKQALAEA